jgi:hypothetical protein
MLRRGARGEQVNVRTIDMIDKERAAFATLLPIPD